MSREKRLAIYVVENVTDVAGIATLGIEPFDDAFTVDRLGAVLAGAPGTVKSTLQDQSIIAGVGNAYSDEVLHAARLSPFAVARKLGDDDVARLHACILSVLDDAVTRSEGLPVGELKAEKKRGLKVHARTGEACPDCGDTIREVSYATKSLQYCPTCQTGGRVLADRRLSRLLR
jgi:formamidopyrimidine-DNA glycosylase